MLSSFSFTLGRSGCGTRRGVYKHTGTASCLSGIRYFCTISPRPLKSLGYSARKSGTFSTLCTSAAGVSSRSACIAGFDRRLFTWLDMTHTFSLWLLPEGSISDLTFEKVRPFYISRTSELAFYWVEFESLEPRCMVTDYSDL